VAISSDEIQALEATMAGATGWQRGEAMAELALRVREGDRPFAMRLASEARCLLEASSAEPDLATRRDGALALTLALLAADRLAERDQAGALDLATRASSLAEEAGAGKPLVMAESVLSAVLVVRGSLGEARDRLVRRLEAIPPAPDQRADLRARVLNDLGRVHYHAGEPEAARGCFLEALELLRGTRNTRIEAVCLTNLANVLSHVGDVEGALETFARSLALHRSAGSRDGTALALHNLAVTHHHIGDFAAAAQYARDAEEELKHGDSNSISAPNLLQLSSSLLALGEPREALACADRAIELEEAAGNPVGVARALTGRASVLGELSRSDAALADAQRALVILEGDGDPEWHLACRRVIAELHLGQGLPELALRLAEPLVEDARALGNVTFELDVARLVLQCARRAGRHELALAHGDRVQALEAASHRRERTQHVETLKLRHQLEQGRHREEALRVARAELEGVVMERTRELIAANEGLKAAISARDQADRDRRRLEEQLHHSQKMEAMGRVAGEVAHDFNNLLTVVSGNAALLLADLAADDPRHGFAHSIDVVATKGAALTRQLLAFSRKAEVNPTLLDVNELLRSAEGLMRSVAGPRVEVVMRLDADVGTVRADRAQLEQVLMNLVTNARDAMPDGGTLTVESRAVDVGKDVAARRPGASAGPHVVITVADTGHGMDSATQALIFEPFFTTKEAGKGTGLGLAVAFGVVQQCGGFVSVESRPGEGARFGVHLPRVAG
jgi:signal transduction histidine kinase